MHSILRRVLKGEILDNFAPYVCEKIVELFNFPLVWIGSKEKDGIIKVRGASGNIRGIVYDKTIKWNEKTSNKNVEPSVIAIKTYQTSMFDVRESELNTRHNINNIISFPLLCNNEVLGVMEIYSSLNRIDDNIFYRLETLALRLGMAMQIAKDQKDLRLRSTAIASTASAIIITDTNANIEWVNQAFTKQSGYTLNEVVGKNINILKSGFQDKKFYQSLWKDIMSGRNWAGELINRHKMGSLYTVEQIVTPIREDNGEIYHFVTIHNDLTAHKSVEGRLVQLANFDQLTGLPNRRMFQEKLKASIEKAKAKKEKRAVIFVDLTNFNRINDTLGHNAGDALLKVMCERIQSKIRKQDMVARFGGDEFAIVCDHFQSAEYPGNLAYDIIEHIMETSLIQKEEVNIGACVGISIYPDDAKDADKLINYADMALHKAIKNSPNSYCYFSREMNAETEDRISLERDLRRALSHQEFVLYYQPQIDVRSSKISGWEALIRWMHPERGMVPPGKFIPIAEDTGLIVQLGEWVIREALWQWRKWSEMGLTPPTIAINLSAAQFQQEDLAETIENQLMETGVSPDRVELELTETVIMQDVKKANNILTKLSSLGIQIAIDDFGTGYSSLNYLKRFPVDRLKIDQSFVREMTSDYNDAEIARAIINLGHSLGMEVVSEGVENEAQLNLLREQGCDVVQGFLLGRPMPADQVLEYIKSSTINIQK
ncbi:MAG: Phytochrome-like protein cph2 [Alphaproteobacteria bacterium ADurb.Bin438]|nr:MAG: Phytochrome-like protein cph2 [Alphaproteobacteria bacterium ADurb.Bin438]